MQFIVESGMGFTYVIGAPDAAPRYFKRWVRSGMTVYDVGANKGQTALIFAALVGPTGRVVSLEPAPAEFASLERNVRLNRLTCVEMMPVAASEASGVLTFIYNESHPTEGRLTDFRPDYPSPTGKQISVQAIRLDSLLDEHHAPDVIKIDVEGAAAAVLRGARRILEEVSPVVYLEIHNQDEMNATRNELLARGYIATTRTGELVPDPNITSCGALWCYKPGKG